MSTGDISKPLSGKLASTSLAVVHMVVRNLLQLQLRYLGTKKFIVFLKYAFSDFNKIRHLRTPGLLKIMIFGVV